MIHETSLTVTWTIHRHFPESHRDSKSPYRGILSSDQCPTHIRDAVDSESNVASMLTAAHSNALQRTSTRCNTLQHAATRCNSLHHRNALLHNATHCNTPGLWTQEGKTQCYTARSAQCIALQHTGVICGITHPYVRRRIYTWLATVMCDMTHTSFSRCSSRHTRELPESLSWSWLIHRCDMTHSHAWHDSLSCAWQVVLTLLLETDTRVTTDSVITHSLV